MSSSAATVVQLMRPVTAPDKGTLTVSVVIPVVGDNEVLARLLDRLRALPVPPDEIVVVDGGSSAGCRSLARRFQCIYVSTRSGRGHQLHAGALRASGDVLWFLHADAEPHPDGVTLIRCCHRDGAQGGFFAFRFLGPVTWYKRLLARLINYRARYGIPYGDQGLFVARTAYDAAGGFADTPLFEEVPLVRKLRQRGTFSQVAASIGVSPRRWERDGWVQRSIGNRMLACAYMLGVPPRRLARRYRPLGRTEFGADSDSC